ncbi:MAG: anaerobic ribonucleoside-triphosphate reductase activating protein [Bacteroidales bacterium]
MIRVSLPIGGFIRQSLIDYPGHIASVVFLIGCNMRCYYCHNPQLVLPDLIKTQNLIPVGELISWFKRNADLLDAVVVTGGEPTLHPSLPDFLGLLKSFSLKVKLDTNGTNSGMLEALIDNQLVDYVAMDVKAPLELSKYRAVVGSAFSGIQLNEVKKSVAILLKGKVKYEFRTTLNASLNNEDIVEIMTQVRGDYFLQMPNENNHGVLIPEQMGECRVDVGQMLDFAKSLQDIQVNVR